MSAPWRWSKRAFTAIALGCLCYFSWLNQAVLTETIIQADALRLFGAALVWTGMHLLAPVFAALVIRSTGGHLGVTDAARIHLSNLPARYIPGGIWHTVGRAISFHAAGLSARQITSFVIVENMLAVGVAFAMGGTMLYLIRGTENWGMEGALLALGGITATMLLPFVLTQLARIAGGREAAALNSRIYALAALVVAVSWCVGSSAFVLFVSAFPTIDLSLGAAEVAAVYLLAWGIGFLAIFAPQGVGVFEVTAAELLNGVAPLASVAVLLVGFRAVLAVADLIAWSALALLPDSRKTPGTSR